jgi:hypothetical protein
MKKINHYAFTFLLISLLSVTEISGQTVNTYKFIEPNISVSFDSTYFKIGNRYSNEIYGKESYDFSYQGDPSKKVRIHIKADHPIKYPSKKERDSLTIAGIEKIKNTQNDTFAIINIDKQIRDINGFSCVGFVGYNKLKNKYSSYIGCYHYSENDNTEVNYMSTGNDLETEYKILTSFLTGFHSYSQQQIDREDSIIKNKYTVAVTEIKTIPDNLKYRPKTYVGVISTKEKLEHTVSEVKLKSSFGFELFTPNKDGQIYIVSDDRDKGTLTKNGELVLLNSFGKKVKVPFTFTYQNN